MPAEVVDTCQRTENGNSLVAIWNDLNNIPRTTQGRRGRQDGLFFIIQEADMAVSTNVRKFWAIVTLSSRQLGLSGRSCFAP